MGSMDKKGNAGKRNGVQGKFTWRENGQEDVACNWSDVDAALVRGFVDTVSRAGGAVILGITSDGGAYSVCVLLDSEKVKEYPHGKDACEALLRALMTHLVNC